MERSRGLSLLHVMSISIISKVRKKQILINFNIFSQNHAALKTALRLVQYEKELDPKEVYRLIALSAFLNKSFKECSKALAKLENLPNLTKQEKENYQELAISIFTRNDPQNMKENEVKCPGKGCENMISEL
jgi:WD repeat-containing protein 35